MTRENPRQYHLTSKYSSVMVTTTKDTLYPMGSIVDNVQLENVLFGNKSAKPLIQAKVLL